MLKKIIYIIICLSCFVSSFSIKFRFLSSSLRYVARLFSLFREKRNIVVILAFLLR